MSQVPLHLLCIEPRFPGRLGPVADWLVRRRGYRCQFYCAHADARELWPQSVGRGMDVIQFGVGGVAREQSVTWQRHLERGLCYAYGCWEVLDNRRPRPVDLVLGRSAGLGSTLYVPVTYPGTPIVNLLDYFYQAHEHDLADELSTNLPVEYFHWRRAANAMDLLDLENGVIAWTPTIWLRDLYPPEYRTGVVVQYDGVDTRRFARRPRRPASVAGRALPPDTKVFTFVARSLDQVRGFERFMELANRLLRARSDVIGIVVGDPTTRRNLDVQFYNRDYRAHVLSENPPHDPERLWFLGPVPPAIVAEVLQASDLHIYPSRPYPVSRSLVEAMATGCVILASDNAPVREFLTHHTTALLSSSDDADQWEKQALAVLDDPPSFRHLGTAASALVDERYAQEITIPKLAELFDQQLGGIQSGPPIPRLPSRRPPTANSTPEP